MGLPMFGERAIGEWIKQHSRPLRGYKVPWHADLVSRFFAREWQLPQLGRGRSRNAPFFRRPLLGTLPTVFWNFLFY